MAKSSTYTVPFKRKREGKTNYRKRLNYLKSGKPRIIIRRTLNNIIIQSANYDEKGDKILETTTSKELKKFGWSLHTGNVPAAYLTGLLFAKKSKIKEGVIDLGLRKPTKGSRLSAAIKGISDGGIKINYSDKIMPDEKRLKGTHTKSKDAPKIFEETKKNILK
jgi:large subunit ribosomal protein L18